jgi:hypothetical protein
VHFPVPRDELPIGHVHSLTSPPSKRFALRQSPFRP